MAKTQDLDTPFDRLVNILMDRAITGLNLTVVAAHDKARKYAPVRAILRRDRRGDEYRRVSLAPGSTRAQVMRAYRRAKLDSPEQYRAFRRSLAPNRRINVPGPPATAMAVVPRDKWGVPHGSLRKAAILERLNENFPPTGATYGHSNSFQPVIYSKGETETGDFRQWRGGKLQPVMSARRIRGGKVEFTKPIMDEKGNTVSQVEDLITKRGRYEIKTGRAAFKSGPDEPVRIGGALRASIVAIEASHPAGTRRKKIYGYVRAGNERVDYAGYQEFGTRHHRAHPFLRPALYESRQLLVKNVYESIAHQKLKA